VPDDGARLTLVERNATQDCTTIPASAPATVYFGAVEIRNWQIAGQEQVITYPHPAMRLVNGSTITAASYLHRDALGSVRAITDAAGAKVESVLQTLRRADRMALARGPRAGGQGLDRRALRRLGGLLAPGVTVHRTVPCSRLNLNARYYDPELGMTAWIDDVNPSRHEFCNNARFWQLRHPPRCAAFSKPITQIRLALIKTQTVLPCAETVPMLPWALLASGQIRMRSVDGWEAPPQPIDPVPHDLAG
jgi:hypothetical protein